MTGHKFKIGQLVNYLGRERAPGVYQVTHLLPPEGKMFRYRIKKSAWLKRVNFVGCDLHEPRHADRDSSGDLCSHFGPKGSGS